MPCYAWDRPCLTIVDVCTGSSDGALPVPGVTSIAGVPTDLLGCPSTVEWFWLLAGAMGIVIFGSHVHARSKR